MQDCSAAPASGDQCETAGGDQAVAALLNSAMRTLNLSEKGPFVLHGRQLLLARLSRALDWPCNGLLRTEAQCM